MTNLNRRAWLSLAALAICMSVLLFGCAGTADYWQGWVYLAIFVGASALITVHLIRHDPALLERRMQGGPAAETRPRQRVIMFFAGAAFIALLVVPALGRRFGLSGVPAGVALLGDVLVATGFYSVFVVYRTNTFASATIAVSKNQTVISTGPYAIVRHPMYAGALIYLAGTPLALGYYWGFVGLAMMLPFIIWRLIDEERLLLTELPGYVEYRKRVTHRLVPFVW